MSKKWPRIETHSRTGETISPLDKLQPTYWQQRLFRNSYSYKGRRVEVSNWAVKIQHRGRRKTFSLGAANSRRAAREACELFRAILKADSLEGFPAPWTRRPETIPDTQVESKPTALKSSPQYWEQRLILREYAMRQKSNITPPYAVRIDHEGFGSYFPLGTADRNKAAARALRIFLAIQRHGWEEAARRFSREVTIGFRWSDSPLAWTYSTLHTFVRPTNQVLKAPSESLVADSIPVAIAEPDAGVRAALAWCINRMEHFYCARFFSSAAEALAGLDTGAFRLILASQNLPDKPGNVCLGELRDAAPAVACLLYSAYEDSEELFRTTPGGAGTYVLKRTSATQFLEPISSVLLEPNPTPQTMRNGVWQYFKNTLASPPASGLGHELANLTRREEEVLALLGKGQPDKEIADHLRISAHTVHGHVRKIFEKLGVHNRTEAAVRYLQK
jgi:DNA-binding NarL/FixJ family response regulator